MKKNLRIVLGLVFLLYTFASCDPEDEPNALKNNDSPVTISEKEQIQLQPHSYDRKQIIELSCDEIESTTLYAGQHLDVGWVHISNSEDMIFVTYDLNHTSWSLQETHLFIGSEEDIPYTKSGNPKIGHFPYHEEQDDTSSKEYTFAVPKVETEGCVVIIAHAVIENDGDVRSTETAFAYGHENEFPGKRWGWFIDYCLQECDDIDENADSEAQSGYYEAFDQGSNYWNADCLESYAFNSTDRSDSHCFLSDDFDMWGWTNQLFYSQQMNYVTGYRQSFPLLASAYQCDISNSLEVGYVTLRITGGDGRFMAEVEVFITDDTYDLQDFDLYVGAERYPLDNSQNPTILPEFYTYHESSFDAEFFSLGSIPWPSNANFIARAILCPAESE